MTTEVAAPRINGILEDDPHTDATPEDAPPSKREVKNHILFEISTEAANRGKSLIQSFPHDLVVD